MKIESIVLTNFRCFGPTPIEIKLDDLSCLIGNNGTGKTATLEAISRVFGVTQNDRKIRNSDFHVPNGESLEDVEERSLSIELRIEFPEIEDGHASDSIPQHFDQMIIEREGEAPHCRIRLDATWSANNTLEGEIREELRWITSSDNGEERLGVSPNQRSSVQVYYVPAIRNPVKQISNVTGSLVHRLIKSINWSEDLKDRHAELVDDFNDEFSSERAIEVISETLTNGWKNYCAGTPYADVKISPIKNDFEKVVSQIEVLIEKENDSGISELSDLSEGMRSLFYLTLIRSIFDIENIIMSEGAEESGFDDLTLTFPYLSMFCIEEPENHLAPHFLGKITDNFRGLSEDTRAQVLITSHSPAIVKRIHPEEIRHFRMTDAGSTAVSYIDLPEQGDEAYKYVRNAVQAYPELYFSKVVLLCEGDSEEVILPRMLEVNGIIADQSFLSIVPLSGRHVNHFWRLLSHLDVPYITLLDYDRKRPTGGWEKIKYIIQQLLELGIEWNDLLAVSEDEVLTEESLSEMHTWELNPDEERYWLNRLKNYDVYFSQPLDIDALMLRMYFSYYTDLEQGERGPQIPENMNENNAREFKAAYSAVLGKRAGDSLSPNSISNPERYFWYRYLFLNKSKVVSHRKMITRISSEQLLESCPKTFKEIINKLRTMVNEKDTSE